MDSQRVLLTEALHLAQHKQCGSSSEKADESVMEQLSFLFNETKGCASIEKEEPKSTDVAGHKRHKNREYHVCPETKTIDQRQGVDAHDAKKIADYLWSHMEVIEEYLAADELPHEHAPVEIRRKIA